MKYYYRGKIYEAQSTPNLRSDRSRSSGGFDVPRNNRSSIKYEGVRIIISPNSFACLDPDCRDNDTRSIIDMVPAYTIIVDNEASTVFEKDLQAVLAKLKDAIDRRRTKNSRGRSNTSILTEATSGFKKVENCFR